MFQGLASTCTAIITKLDAIILKSTERKPRLHSRVVHVGGCRGAHRHVYMSMGARAGKREAGTHRGEEECIMSPLLLRCSSGCLVTVLGSFSASRNKLVTQAAAASHLYYLRKTMHYLTEERGHPHSPDYRIYFSKLTIATMMGETECVPCVQVTGV